MPYYAASAVSPTRIDTAADSLYSCCTEQTLCIHDAQDKQQSIQYHAAMMLYQKLTVCHTLQTQKCFVSSHKPRTINQT